MNDVWREFLYPLGWLSGLAFSSRFLIQWIHSERAHKSVVTPLFWRISLFGNAALLMHAFIQLQYHICFVQVCNAVISWRNLDLMRTPDKRWLLTTVVRVLFLFLIGITLAFAAQLSMTADATASWFRVPISSWSSGVPPVSLLWHLIGTMGLLLFNSRFWVQWWQAEREERSHLGPAFWWMSLSGAILCGAYFLKIQDLVNLLGPLFGIIPAIRNLMIIREEAMIQKKLLRE